jgi:uncharacterized protein involved in response to NO
MKDREYCTTAAVLSYGFRPFFLAVGRWAILAIGLWLTIVLGYVRLPSRFDPVTWHAHEMLFGVVLAAVAGFLLTAIATWTGRRPVSRRPLVLPSFTRNWLMKRGSVRLPAPHGPVDIIALGVGLLGFSVLGVPIPIASGLHALSVGAIGTMILAVMARVSLGHTGRPLIAGRPTAIIFLLINLAAIARVVAAWSASPRRP